MTKKTGVRAVLSAGVVFLLALNLRPALTSVGPVLDTIGADLHIGESALGLLGSIPVFAFGVAALIVPRIADRFGSERTVLVALLVLVLAILARSYLGVGGLWIGTFAIGCAISVGNVLVPVLTKRAFPSHVSAATSVYTTFLTGAAATASAVAVPLTVVLGWQHAFAIWAIPALLVALVWFPRVPRRSRANHVPAASSAPRPTTDHPSVWTQPTAWAVTAYMGLQSTLFYSFVTWMASIDVAAGASAAGAGFHVFLFQLVGLPAGLLIPFALRGRTQIPGAMGAAVAYIIAAAGYLWAPELGTLWAIFVGIGSGCSLVVALSLIGLRGRTHMETTRLSAMSQSIGYICAACGPVLLGTLTEVTGTWTASLSVLLGIAVLLAITGVLSGIPRSPGSTRTRLAV